MKIKKNFLKRLKNNFLLGIRVFFYFFFCELKLLIKRFLKRRKFPEINIQIKDINFRMITSLEDRGLSDQLLLNGIREYPNVHYFIDFIIKHKEEINNVIDIGANIGYYALFADAIFRKCNKTNVNIFAVEPVKFSYNLLKRNVVLNDFLNIKCVNAAVGESDKKVIMAVPEAKNLSHMENVVKANKLIKSYEKQCVDMFSLETISTLCNISKDKILFRWDVEGYEYQIVKGNKEFFKGLKKAFIVMEFHAFLLEKEEAVDFLKIIKEVGFKLDLIVTCCPEYFLYCPKSIRKFLYKTWIWEKENDPIGQINRIKDIDDLIKEIYNENSPIYNHPHPHLYFVKS